MYSRPIYSTKTKNLSSSRDERPFRGTTLVSSCQSRMKREMVDLRRLELLSASMAWMRSGVRASSGPPFPFSSGIDTMKQGWYHEMAFRPARTKGFLFLYYRLVWNTSLLLFIEVTHRTSYGRSWQ